MFFYGTQIGVAYQVQVEGCDYSDWTGHTCTQGWTIPMQFTY